MARLRPIERKALITMEEGTTSVPKIADELGIPNEEASDVLRSLRMKGKVVWSFDAGYDLKDK